MIKLKPFALIVVMMISLFVIGCESIKLAEARNQYYAAREVVNEQEGLIEELTFQISQQEQIIEHLEER